MNNISEYADREVGHEVIVKYFQDYSVYKEELKNGIQASIEARAQLVQRPDIYRRLYEEAISKLRKYHDDLLAAIAKGLRERALERNSAEVDRILRQIVLSVKLIIGSVALIGAVVTILATGPSNIKSGVVDWHRELFSPDPG